MFIFTLQSSQLSVCVFKINRPCDEQPVPCWKYILWNTTVLCRNLAKHWLGSIELQLYYTVKQQEKYTFTRPPFQKTSLSSACLKPRHADTNRAFLSVKEAAQKPAESVLQRAEPHLHIMTGYPSLLRVQQLHATVNSNHLRNDLCHCFQRDAHLLFFRLSFDI